LRSQRLSRTKQMRTSLHNRAGKTSTKICSCDTTTWRQPKQNYHLDALCINHDAETNTSNVIFDFLFFLMSTWAEFYGFRVILKTMIAGSRHGDSSRPGNAKYIFIPPEQNHWTPTNKEHFIWVCFRLHQDVIQKPHQLKFTNDTR